MSGGVTVERHPASESTEVSRPAVEHRPATRSVVFASLFTPTWSLGLLLFACLFLPFIRTCNDSITYPYELFSADSFTAAEIWNIYFFTLPFWFGLVVAAGSLTFAVTRSPACSRGLWWCYSLILAVNSLLLVAMLIETWVKGESISWEPGSWLVFGGLTGAVLLAPLTARFCKSDFNAATWLQIFLCTAAAIIVSLLGGFGRLMIGGQLAIASSVFLIITSIVQRMDGYRCLTRKSHRESPLQLSLRGTLVLMLVGGLACVWVGGRLFDSQLAAAARAAEETPAASSP